MAPKGKAERERALKAVKEMKAMGFPMEKTKTVLRALLKSVENNWDMIEQENYSVLVDSLIQADTVEGSSGRRDDKENGDDGEEEIGAELCHKKRQKHKLDESSLFDSHARNALEIKSIDSTDPKPPSDLEIGAELCHKKRQKRKLDESSLFDSHARNALEIKSIDSTDPKPPSDLVRTEISGKGKGIAFSSSHDEMTTTGRLQSLVTYTEPEATVKSGDGGADSPRYEPPIAVIHPSVPFSFSQSEGLQSLSDNCLSGDMGDSIQNTKKSLGRTKEPRTHFKSRTLDNGNTEKGIADNHSAEIASSPNGKVRLSLSWDSTEANFQMPRLETLMKMVEDKCLKSYKLLQPKFCLMNIMKEICQAALDLGQQNDTIDPNANAGPSNASSLGLVSARQHEPSLGDVRPLHDVNDIAKGEEMVKISVVNDINSRKFPPSFFYISHNVVYQSGHVNFSLARIGDEDCCSDCFGDCLSASIPCTCARETGGEFAYDIDGTLKKKFLDDYISSIHSTHDPQNHHYTYCKDCPLERSKNEVAPDPCKGHLVRKFIKECWIKCGCNRQCGNRVVQRGIARNLQVFFSGSHKGWGLRTLGELPRGAFVCEYIGEVLTNMELYDRTLKITINHRHTYPVLLDADWGSEKILKDEEALCLDATFYGNVARFINHRCNDANLIEIPVEIETADRHYYHLAFFTTRKVEALEELTWDYGIDFDDHGHPIKSFVCKCGSMVCRDGKKRARSKAKALVLR